MKNGFCWPSYSKYEKGEARVGLRLVYDVAWKHLRRLSLYNKSLSRFVTPTTGIHSMMPLRLLRFSQATIAPHFSDGES